MKKGREETMKTVCKSTSVFLFLMLSASMVLAGHQGKGKGKHGDDESEQAGAHDDTFVGIDRDMIRHHYAGYRAPDYRGLPPGLAKRGGDLPPGLEKHLQRNGHLPPGLEKKLYPFPVELEHRLPPLRPGLTRGIIGGHAVIMDKKSSVILDIFAIL